MAGYETVDGSLAQRSDVAEVLGRDLTDSESARLGPVLLKASALFRREARQDFTPGRSAPRLKVNGGRVYLPQAPVTEVHSVVDDGGAAVEWTRKDQWLTTCLDSSSFVTVDYSHGSADIPELVVLTVAEIGKKVLSVSIEAQQGVASYSETKGPFAESRTYAGWAQGGQTSLSPDDLAIARSFRVRVPTVHVATANAASEDFARGQLTRWSI